MAWKDIIDLSEADLGRLQEYQIPELELKLASFIDKDNFGRDLKCGAILDCFINVFQYSTENSFSTAKLSCLLRIQGMLLDHCQQGVALEESYGLLLKTVHAECKDDILTIKSIINHLLPSFMQHYHLYSYIFTEKQEQTQLTNVIEVDVAPARQPFPHPLEEAVLLNLFEEYISPKPIVEDSSSTNEDKVDTIASADNEADSGEDDVSKLVYSMKPEQLKNLIREVADSKFKSLKAEVDGKISDRESALMKTFTKLHAR